MDGLIGRLTRWSRRGSRSCSSTAEDPSVTLDYSYERQRALLLDVKRGVADVVTAKKRIQLQSDTLEQTVLRLENQARRALAAGREDLARAALERKAFAQQQLQTLDVQAAGLEQQQQKLVESEERLAMKVETFRSQKEVIKAEYSRPRRRSGSARPRRGSARRWPRRGSRSSARASRTQQLQARSAALDELVEAGTLEDFTTSSVLDRELAQLDARALVESDLARLQGEVGGGQRRALEEEVRGDRARHGRGQDEVDDPCSRA